MTDARRIKFLNENTYSLFELEYYNNTFRLSYRDQGRLRKKKFIKANDIRTLIDTYIMEFYEDIKPNDIEENTLDSSRILFLEKYLRKNNVMRIEYTGNYNSLIVIDKVKGTDFISILDKLEIKYLITNPMHNHD